jgi:hypothetical protein
MNTSRAILFLILSVFSISCYQKKITGTYFNKSEPVTHKLELKSDSTFTYKVAGDVGEPMTTTGKWSFNSNVLSLKSYDSLKKISLIGRDSFKLKSPVILIKESLREDFINEYITFDNDSTKYYFDHNQIIVPLGLINFKKLCFNAFEMNECKTRKDSNENFFEIFYNNNDNRPTWYINDKWIFRRGKFYKDESFFLKKTN